MQNNLETVEVQAYNQTKETEEPLIQQIWIRKQQPLILYSLVIICEVYTSIQVIITIQGFVKNSQWTITFWILFATSLFRLIIFTINSMFMSNCRGIFYAYITLDILGVLNLCTSGVFIGLILAFAIPYNVTTHPLTIMCQILIVLVYLSYLGNFRLTMATCIWDKKRVIFYKLKVYACCMALIGIGIFFSFNKLNNDDCIPCDFVGGSPNGDCEESCKKATDCCLDDDNFLKTSFATINEFYIFFLAASLAFTAQLVASLSDRDGVNDLQTHYTIGMGDKKQKSETRNNRRQLQELTMTMSNINNL